VALIEAKDNIIDLGSREEHTQTIKPPTQKVFSLFPDKYTVAAWPLKNRASSEVICSLDKSISVE